MAEHTDSREGLVEIVVVRGKDALRSCTLKCSPETGELVLVGGEEIRDQEADVTLSLMPADADAVASGALDPTVAFMRGQMKMAGDSALLLSVLPLMRGSGFDAARKCLAGE